VPVFVLMVPMLMLMLMLLLLLLLPSSVHGCSHAG
jgi:hypothetical protein